MKIGQLVARDVGEYRRQSKRVPDSCTWNQKIIYRTERDAEAHARKINASRREDRKLRPYLCKCGWFHLTSGKRR